MNLKHLWFIIFICVFFPNLLFPQIIVTGYIKDARSREPLPAANIQIEGTYQGTITNDDGKFLLELSQLPVTLLITYIGYKSERIDINEKPEGELLISLQPVILEGKPLLVTAEDPALDIMREVIRRKQIWRKKLNTYRAEGYSRTVLENDSGIVSIEETISELFWHKAKGIREVVNSKRQTSNLSENQNLAAASYIPNFYDDDIELIGFKVIGPTHPKALKYYTFKLKGERLLDEQIVYDIEVVPTSKLQPTFYGHIALLDSVFALLEVNLRPNESILFPPPIQEWNVDYKQQFSNYGGKFWFPVDFRSDGDIRIGFPGLQFPPIIYQERTRLTNYLVNIDLPDSLYEEDETLTIDSLAIKQDTLFTQKKDLIPLSAREDSAYTNLDSTMTLEKAYKPTGFLARSVDVEVGEGKDGESKRGKELLSYFGPQLWYNRVDALHVGLNFKKTFSNQSDFRLEVGYSTGPNRWSYGGGFKYYLQKKSDNWINLKYRVGTKTSYHSENYSITLASLLPLFARPDYYDYYWSKSLLVEFGHEIKSLKTSITMGVNYENDTSLEKETDFNITWNNKKQRPNQPIDEGDLNSILFRINYGGE